MSNHSFSKHNLHEISTFAIDLSLRAGELILQERRNAKYETSFKNHQEIVTSADIKVDEFIQEHIQRNYPDHQILSEEGMNELSRIKDNKLPLWVVDPIDGTVNFAHGHHQVAVSIAYFEGSEANVGVVHAPFQKETFHAIRHQSAVMNHKPIKVSAQTDFRQALIATGFPYHKNSVDQLVNRLRAVLAECQDIRRIGSAALDICWVAMGRMDAYYETISPWDFAAAQLIAREAGACCGHLNPVPDNIPEELYGEDIIISSPAIYNRLKELLTMADQG